MKFLAIPTLLAATAQAASLAFTTDIPVDGFWTIGTDFVLEWKAYDATATDTFKLTISAWNRTISGYSPGPFGIQIPTYDTKEIVLGPDVKFLDESYAWTVEPLDDAGAWKGLGFNYFFAAEWGLTVDSPRVFHIED